MIHPRTHSAENEIPLHLDWCIPADRGSVPQSSGAIEAPAVRAALRRDRAGVSASDRNVHEEETTRDGNRRGTTVVGSITHLATGATAPTMSCAHNRERACMRIAGADGKELQS